MGGINICMTWDFSAQGTINYFYQRDAVCIGGGEEHYDYRN